MMMYLGERQVGGIPTHLPLNTQTTNHTTSLCGSGLMCTADSSIFICNRVPVAYPKTMTSNRWPMGLLITACGFSAMYGSFSCNGVKICHMGIYKYGNSDS